MSVEENKRTILHVLAAYNERDLKAFYDGFDPRCAFPSLATFGLPPTLESFKIIIPTMLGAFPDIQNTVKDIVAEEDRVVVRVIEKGTHRGTWQNIAATNRLVEYQEIVFYRLANGKIVEWIFFFDTFSLFNQLRN